MANQQNPNQYTPQPQAQPMRRTLPQNDLDLALMTTDSVWGKAEVPPELRSRLNKYFRVQDKDGNKGVTVESLWGLLGFYTRDMRLANLSAWNGELQYCQYYLDLANDLLQANMIEPFMITLSRVATILELSQSKGGFLRRKMNTFTQEQINRQDEPPKKSLFGGSNKKQNGSGGGVY